jgi:hypothetical protein
MLVNIKLITCLFVVATLATGCSKSPNITTDSSQLQAEPIRGQVYRSLDGGTVLTVISRDECELREGGTTLLCKYTKQADALRVVVTAMGTTQVIYYRFTDQGIQDNNGGVLLSPERYAAAVEQARAAQEREQRARQEAEQKILAEESRKRAAYEERKAKFISWVRSYFAANQKHEGRYGVKPVHTFTFTLTADAKLSTPGTNKIAIDAVGIIDWHGSPPGDKNNNISLRQEDVHLRGDDLWVGESDKFGGFIKLTRVNSGKEYNLIYWPNQGMIRDTSFVASTSNDGFDLDSQ